MKPKKVEVPTIQQPIQPSPGFAKKLLSEHKLDLIGLCQFGCSYCSSNHGNYLRINRKQFADLTEEQLGERSTPSDDPALMFIWPEIMVQLRNQLERAPKSWGAGKTLVFSMLTDGFSPQLVSDGTTEEALRLVLERTSFRIRVLTKNAIVGSRKWITFFRQYCSRFVVGLSIGTIDDKWAKRVERHTSVPSARIAALRALQKAEVPTYGMACPIFPHMLDRQRLEKLVEAISPRRLEHVWAEPFNDRFNWHHVRSCMDSSGVDYQWMTDVFENRKPGAWSNCATELYLRLKAIASRKGWVNKLRYLLYEDGIAEKDAAQFAGFNGVLLQSKPGNDGRSQNRFIAALQSSDLRY